MKRRNFLNLVGSAFLGISLPISFNKKKQSVIEFLEENAKVFDYKKGEMIPFRATKHHKELAELFENPKVIVKKYRQGGFSTFGMLWCLHECIHKANYHCCIVSRTYTESGEWRKMLNRTLNELPPGLCKTIIDSNRVIFSNGSSIDFCTPITLIGKSIDVLMLDEVAFFHHYDMQFVETAMNCGAKKIFGISTPSDTRGWFYETWNKKNDFIKYHPRYYEHPYYQDEAKIEEMKGWWGQKWFKQEVLAEFQDEPYME